MSSQPETVFCYFRVRPGDEEKLCGMLREHDAVLRRLGLITDEPTRVYRGEDEPDGRPFIVKLFEWRGAEALDAAHNHPEVQVLWEAMEPLCEPRDGRPNMEFPHVAPVAL